MTGRPGGEQEWGRPVSTLLIEGGRALSGRVVVGGNKNAALPLIAACLLTDEECVLTNVPHISDVEVMARLLADLGAEVEGIGTSTLRIRCTRVERDQPQSSLVGRLRGSVLLLGPLLARRGSVRIAPPGGDFPARRTIAMHLGALRAMGAQELEGEGHVLEVPKGLTGASMYLEEASVTGTETALLAAASARGLTEIRHAACEPHVVELCAFLRKMGAGVSGEGTHTIRVEGAARLRGATHRLNGDYIEAGSWAVVAAVTGTNGKTSTAEFTRQLWAAAGRQAASLGTLGLIAPGQQGGVGLTTPDPVSLAASMAALAQDGVTDVAIEASSHGLDQFRLDGLRLCAGAFTNLTRDHLDYHGSMAAYRDAKLRLFRDLLPPGAPALVSGSLDAESRAALRAIAQARGLAMEVVGLGGDALRLVASTPLTHGQRLGLQVDGVAREVELPLVGAFQADNALLAAGLARATGVADAIDLLPHLTGVRGTGGDIGERCGGVCGFRPHAGCAGTAADRAAAACGGAAGGDYWRRRRSGPRQAPADGRGGGGACRSGDRDRRQSAQRSPGGHSRGGAGRLPRRGGDRRPCGGHSGRDERARPRGCAGGCRQGA